MSLGEYWKERDLFQALTSSAIIQDRFGDQWSLQKSRFPSGSRRRIYDPGIYLIKKTPSDPFLMVNSTGLNYMVPPPFCPNVSVYTMMVPRTVKVLKMYTVCRLTNQPTQPCICWQKTQLCHRQWILFLAVMQAAWTLVFLGSSFPASP